MLDFLTPFGEYCLVEELYVKVIADGIQMPVVDSLGDDFLTYVKEGMTITVKDGGVVCVE